MKTIILFLVSLAQLVSCQFPDGPGGPGGPDGEGPRPLPMGMPGMPGMPGFSGRGGMMNPFLGPQMPNGNMQDNNQQRNRNQNTPPSVNKAQGGQQRSSDGMLEQMGLQGIQPFYASLTSELTRTPTGMGMGLQGGIQGNY